MYGSKTDHPRIKGSHQVGSLNRFWAKDDTDGYTMPSAYNRAENRRAIAEGLAQHAEEIEAALLDSMPEGEREMFLYGRDRTMEALHAEALAENFQHDQYRAYADWWDDYTTGDRLPRRTAAPAPRKARFAADVDLEERALRRDGVIHFAGLANKRRTAKRTWATRAPAFDPSKVSKTLSPTFEQASA